METIIKKFSDLTAKPVNYLTVQNDINGDIKNLIKTLYDFTKSEEKIPKKTQGGALHEMIIEELDEEQVWQQIELQNAERWDHLVWEVANCISNKNDLRFPVEIPEPENESDDEKMRESEGDYSATEKDDVAHTSKANVQSSKKERNINKKSSIVDDQFFKLRDMEQFLINEERVEEKGKIKDDDEESIDLFNDIYDEDSDNEQDMMYKDFYNDYCNDDEENNKFDESMENNDLDYDMADEDISSESDNVPADTTAKKSNKKVKFSDLQPDNEADPNNTVIDKDVKKSEFELRQERLKQQISRLEEKLFHFTQRAF